MPSYADEYAARHPDWQRGAHTGPIRLTISRGDAYRRFDGKVLNAERWDEEEIMELVSSIDAETDNWKPDSAQQNDRSIVDTIRMRLDRGSHRLMAFSLLVLDTNVLLSTLPFLKILVKQCLDRNVVSLSNAALPSSPIVFIVPHVVLSELDNLKTSSKGNVAPMARAANAWLLSTLQSQKRHMYDAIVEDKVSRINIPESSWVLHVENTAHTIALGQEFSLLSPDEQIVRLCVSLKKDTTAEVFFCSEDINARMRAEIDGLPSLSFKDIVQDVREDQELIKLADDLIEQWLGQVFGSVEESSVIDSTEEDNYLIAGGSSTNHNRSVSEISGQTTQHSVFAAQIPPSKQRQIQATSHRISTLTNRNTINHQYPHDRSTASSMWAA